MQGKWEAADRIIEKMKTGDFGGRGVSMEAWWLEALASA